MWRIGHKGLKRDGEKERKRDRDLSSEQSDCSTLFTFFKTFAKRWQMASFGIYQFLHLSLGIYLYLLGIYPNLKTSVHTFRYLSISLGTYLNP